MLSGFALVGLQSVKLLVMIFGSPAAPFWAFVQFEVFAPQLKSKSVAKWLAAWGGVVGPLRSGGISTPYTQNPLHLRKP